MIDELTIRFRRAKKSISRCTASGSCRGRKRIRKSTSE